MNDSASLPHSSSPASVSSVPADDPRRHGLRRDIKSILNVLVLLGSIVVIVSLSLEVFHGAAESYYRLYMRVQFWVCIVFLVDFFYRFFLSRRKWRFFFGNLIFLLVSIPYLNIVDAFHLSLSAEAYYLIRLMPLVRGGYGLAIMVGWIARNRVTSLLISYVLMIFALSYFASLGILLARAYDQSYGHILWEGPLVGVHERDDRRVEHRAQNRDGRGTLCRARCGGHDAFPDFYGLHHGPFPASQAEKAGQRRAGRMSRGPRNTHAVHTPAPVNGAENGCCR